MSAPEDDEDGDDELALALARRAAIPPSPWESVLRGEAELEQVAAREGVDPERARVYFTPLEPERVASIVDAVLAAGAAERASDVEAREPEPAKVVELASRRRSSGGALVIGSLLALAAGLALWWAWPGSKPAPGGGVATRERIPQHALEVGGWLKEVRADPDPAAPAPVRYRYAADGEFEWLLRPSAGVEGALALRAFVLDPSPRVLALDDMVDIAASGAIRVAGTIDRLALAPGRHTIMLVVARPDALPDAAELAAAPADAAWRSYRIELELIE